MRKVVLITMCLILMTTFCFAQARNASPLTLSHTRSNFTNVGVTGLNQDGNPGYLVMTGAAFGTGVDENRRPEYYIWVDETGDLCIASHGTISTYASFPDGSWAENNFSGACTKVGDQS